MVNELALAPVNNHPKEPLFMAGQGDRIEEKLDNLTALLHQEIGAAPGRKEIVDGLKRTVAMLEARVNGLESEVDQAKGSAKTFKWIAAVGGVGGLTGVGSLLAKLAPLFGG